MALRDSGLEVNDANGAQTPLTTAFRNPTFGPLPGPLIDHPTGALGALVEGDGTALGNDNPYTTETNSWSTHSRANSPAWPK